MTHPWRTETLQAYQKKQWDKYILQYSNLVYQKSYSNDPSVFYLGNLVE